MKMWKKKMDDRARRKAAAEKMKSMQVGTEQMSQALDAILAEVAEKYGENVEDSFEIVIPKPKVGIHIVSAFVSEDNYKIVARRKDAGNN